MKATTGIASRTEKTCTCGEERTCRRHPSGDPAAREVDSGPVRNEQPLPAPVESRAGLVLGATFVLAFCSIVYELLLGQTLTAFLGNTVLRYSVTIGLYMLSMGLGALLAGPRILRRPVVSLQAVEVLLTVLGGGSVLLLFVLDAAAPPMRLFTLVAHTLITVIGVLTGLEIPLLFRLRSPDGRQAHGEVLGIDYAGAFAGTVVFALWFYPRAGLLPTALGVASLNAAVGLAMWMFGDRVEQRDRRLHRGLLIAQAVLLAVLLVGLANHERLTEAALRLYIDG